MLPTTKQDGRSSKLYFPSPPLQCLLACRSGCLVDWTSILPCCPRYEGGVFSECHQCYKNLILLDDVAIELLSSST
ncbi:hypothetical protein AVEN_176333-1 [Araneus ventricosus]|uniref:Uncharacterized protein n=1 Tax=Araneus ventricosus TaxID=182803 RepID=A0A4Y2RU73_ARAVE|nr:hypothetical protein AVEN_176333-1 [Araneus ventricosus]